MKPYRWKWSIRAVCDELGVTVQHVVRAVQLGLLKPDRWDSYDNTTKAQIIDKEFKDVQWDLSEVERYKDAMNFAMEEQSFTFLQISRRMTEQDLKINRKLDDLEKLLIRQERLIYELGDKISDTESRIDHIEFCKITGYSVQTFHNSKVWTDRQKTQFRVTLARKLYYELLWQPGPHRTHVTSRMQFNEIRRGLGFNRLHEERKRKGEVESKVNYSKLPINLKIDDKETE